MSNNGPVLITGCSSGVGRAAARAFHAAGYATFATARNPATLDELAAIGCETLALDVTDEAARRAAVEAVERRFGAVGILVNNAGYGQYGPIEEITLDAMRRQFETNVFGAMRLSQLVLPAMRRAGKGRIVNVSSVAGRVSVMGGGGPITPPNSPSRPSPTRCAPKSSPSASTSSTCCPGRLRRISRLC